MADRGGWGRSSSARQNRVQARNQPRYVQELQQRAPPQQYVPPDQFHYRAPRPLQEAPPPQVPPLQNYPGYQWPLQQPRPQVPPLQNYPGYGDQWALQQPRPQVPTLQNYPGYREQWALQPQPPPLPPSSPPQTPPPPSSPPPQTPPASPPSQYSLQQRFLLFMWTETHQNTPLSRPVARRPNQAHEDVPGQQRMINVSPLRTAQQARPDTRPEQVHPYVPVPGQHEGSAFYRWGLQPPPPQNAAMAENSNAQVGQSSHGTLYLWFVPAQEPTSSAFPMVQGLQQQAPPQQYVEPDQRMPEFYHMPPRPLLEASPPPQVSTQQSYPGYMNQWPPPPQVPQQRSYPGYMNQQPPPPPQYSLQQRFLLVMWTETHQYTPLPRPVARRPNQAHEDVPEQQRMLNVPPLRMVQQARSEARPEQAHQYVPVPGQHEGTAFYRWGLQPPPLQNAEMAENTNAELGQHSHGTLYLLFIPAQEPTSSAFSMAQGLQQQAPPQQYVEPDQRIPQFYHMPPRPLLEAPPPPQVSTQQSYPGYMNQRPPPQVSPQQSYPGYMNQWLPPPPTYPPPMQPPLPSYPPPPP